MSSPQDRGAHMHRDDGLFESLEISWHSIASGVEATWTNIASSATSLLPISEENGLEGDRVCIPQSARRRPHGQLASCQPVDGMRIAPNSGITYYVGASNNNATPSNLAVSSLPASGFHSPLPSQDASSGYSLRSTANTIACFGSAAETYYVKSEEKLTGTTSAAHNSSRDAQRRETRSAPRTPRKAHNGRVSSAPYPDAASAEQRMWNSLPAAADGSFKIPKPKDMCDKETRSKIETWMSTASPLIEDDSSHGKAEVEKKASERNFGLQSLEILNLFHKT